MSLDWLKKHPEYKIDFINKLQKYKSYINAHKFGTIYTEIKQIPYMVTAFTELLLKADIDPLIYMNYIPQYYLHKSDVYINFEPLKHFDTIDKEAFSFSNVKEININVPIIYSDAFSYCKKLEIVTLPTIITINDEVFEGCENLTQLWVGKSLLLIKKYAFSGCDSLTDIFYEGTQEDWNKIAIDSSNTVILNATIHFNSIVK